MASYPRKLESRTPFLVLIGGFFVLSGLLPVKACLWDRDTLAKEAQGKLDTVRAITGWFDRHPPRYYEMRLERVTKELAADPNRLDLYDDAAVACSRLGHQDEAISWMERKKSILDALPPEGTFDSRYRYLSNIGTFYLIRWMAMPQAARKVEFNDLKTSETYINQALELNPGAHFGREKFQLMLIRWLLWDPVTELDAEPSFVSFCGSFDPEESRRGITGLIELGAAWQSVDTFRTLQDCLNFGQYGYLARLAYLREEELFKAGMTSLHTATSMQPFVSRAYFYGMVKNPQPVDDFYLVARNAADQRNAAWTAYQEERFAKGTHPDTHPGFWNEWQEPEMPQIPDRAITERFGGPSWIFINVIFFLAAIGLPIALLVFLFRRGKRNCT